MTKIGNGLRYLRVSDLVGMGQLGVILVHNKYIASLCDKKRSTSVVLVHERSA